MSGPSESPAARRPDFRANRSGLARAIADGRGLGCLLAGDGANVALEIGILSFKQLIQGGAEVASTTPRADVVIPRLPKPCGLVGHFLIVDQDVGALELRGQDLEQHVAPLALLVRVGRLLLGWCQQTEVRVLQRQLEEGLVVVRKFQVDLYRFTCKSNLY